MPQIYTEQFAIGKVNFELTSKQFDMLENMASIMDANNRAIQALGAIPLLSVHEIARSRAAEALKILKGEA